MSAPGTITLSPSQARACLAVIVLLAALVRFWNLDGLPPGLFRDEAEKGYTALELWSTARQGQFLPDGTIETTRLLPIFVDAGGVKTSAIYQYLSAPIVGVFGLHVWTTRFVAALVGTLTVIATFLLARLLFTRDDESPIVPLAAALFVALSPTHVLFSRWAQQGITLPLLVTLGVFCLLRITTAPERHRRALSLGGGALLAVAAYAYDPARLGVPLIALGAIWEFRARGGRWRDLLPAALLFAVIEIPLILFTLTEGSARLSRVSLFADRSVTGGLVMALLNYLSHFSPLFLFVSGDANPRHSLPLSGLLPWAEAPFFVLGLLAMVWKRPPGARVLAVWLLAAPVAAALTVEGIPHALRSILFFPAVHLVSALGVGLLIEWLGMRRAVAAVAASACVTLVLLVVALSVFSRQGAPWQYGVLQALAAMDERQPEGPNVLSAEVPYAHYYVLFHDRPAPADFHERGLDAARTLILFPGMPLPPGALVARPPSSPFEREEPGDIPALEGLPGDPPAMAIRAGW
jgi:4-amino-4-deoxy-L-arabinose transferase-like glycosyltransferase